MVIDLDTLKDLTGQKFGRLTVICRADDHVSENGRHRVCWHCICECGNEVDVLGESLRSKVTKSCGCFRKEFVSKYNKEHKKKQNEYEIINDYIIARTNNGIEFLIDKDDELVLKEYYWAVNCDGYLITYERGSHTHLLLHRLILNCNDDKVVDHINGNPLDNRKCNLRIVTQQQNSMNQKLSSNNSSGVTGVYFRKTNKKWKAQIGINNMVISLGYFSNFDDAVAARKAAEEKYFGEYSFDNSRNKITEQTEVVS